jgi:hypothetical protein
MIVDWIRLVQYGGQCMGGVGSTTGVCLGFEEEQR